MTSNYLLNQGAVAIMNYAQILRFAQLITVFMEQQRSKAT
jgi:hypothetical protein